MKKFLILLLAGLMLCPASMALAQRVTTPEEDQAAQKDALHLNTIGAFSAGFVLQSYGYVGVLADALSKGVYEPDLVRSMLAETTSYLRNVNTQLKKYQNNSLVSAGDQKFIATMMDTIDQLLIEADALSSFAKTKSPEDLKRYEEARKNALKNIKKTFGV